MAVAFDAVGPSSTGSNGTTSPETWSHAGAAGATAVYVGASYDSAADGGQTMSATYGGTSMTSLGVWHTNNSTVGFLQVWKLENLQGLGLGGTRTVSITFTGAPAGVMGGSISVTGSGGSSAVQSATGNGTTTSLGFTGSVSGNLVVGFTAAGQGLNQTGSFTQRFNCVPSSGSAGAGFLAGQTIAGTGGTVTDSMTDGTGDFWAVAAVEAQVPAAGGPGPPSFSAPWSRVAVSAGFAGRPGAGHSL